MAESARTLMFPLRGPTGVKSAAPEETERLFGHVVSLRSDLMRWAMFTPAEEDTALAGRADQSVRWVYS